MANTDVLHSVTLGEEHLPGALRLSAEANWNQVETDWRLMMTHGHAVGRVAADNRLVASALALPFGDRLGWISMVLVTADWRRQGLASDLVLHCIDWLEQRGVQPVLDATAAGAQVYRPLGFRTVRRITRWQRPGRSSVATNHSPLPAVGAAALPQLLSLDAEIFGAPRPFVLQDLVARAGEASACAADGSGYAFSRRGRAATQIGPLSAKNPAMALHLLRDMLGKMDGAVFIDAYEDQQEFCTALELLGFVPQRGFERMIRGSLTQFGDGARSFAAAGPELG